MLIIFDLDDTLIDTTGSLVPLKLKDALQKMVDAGLKINTFQEALNILYEIDSTSPNGEESINNFLKKINADNSFLKLGMEEMYKPVSDDIVIKTIEGAQDILNELKIKNVLALVSKGKKELQLQKMEKSGIDKNLFRKIIITENYNKKDKYQEIMQELNFLPTNTVVIGDKFYSDLLPAKELGITTVQMLWGRALKYPEDGADYKIEKLSELNGVLNQILNKHEIIINY